MIVLGLHKDPWHNTAAAMIRDDGSDPRIVYVSEERLDRIKDSRSFPQQSIAACMKELGVNSIDEINVVVMDYICDNSDWKKDYFKTPCRTDIFLRDLPSDRIHIVNHHLLHACATYYSSPFDDAAVLIVDGRGSNKETQSLYRAIGKTINRVEHTNAIGIGLLYATVTQAIGFTLLQEGKTMGLAPYGAEIKNTIFSFESKFDGIKTDYSHVCDEDKYTLLINHPPITTFDDKARAAFEVQSECEKAMIHMANHAKKMTGSPNLCLSGGVALNSVANNRIRVENLFDDIYINPAASDTGIAFGAALYGYHIIGQKPRIRGGITPFLGPTYTPEDFRKAAARHEGYRVHDDHAFELATDLLVENKILGCVQGRSEMGPRALGNRSILMSPMGKDNKNILNSRVKHREEFRPFAPAVLLHRASEFFDIDRGSPYMLFICNVRENKRHLVPAITHVDGTARLQTLTSVDNGRFYDLVSVFGERTGVPILLNTSFNVAGEPIVETPDDAIKCFLNTDIDALLLGDLLLVKPNTA